MNERKNKKWLLWILLIFLPPIGIIYMWVTKKDFTRQTKIILSVVFSLWFIIALASGNNNSTSNNQSVANNISTKEQSTTLKNETASATKKSQSTTKATQKQTETESQTQEPTTEEPTTEEVTTEPEPTINEDINENNSNNNAGGNENYNEEPEPYVTANTFTYVLNTSTKKFHVPSCSEIKKMKQKNYSEYTGTADEVISMGYTACKRCHPR